MNIPLLVAIAALVFCFLSLGTDAYVSYVGTRRRLANEGNELFVDKKTGYLFDAKKYTEVQLPILGLLTAATIASVQYPIGEYLMAVCSGALGFHHVPAILAWRRFFKGSK